MVDFDKTNKLKAETNLPAPAQTPLYAKDYSRLHGFRLPGSQNVHPISHEVS